MAFILFPSFLDQNFKLLPALKTKFIQKISDTLWEIIPFLIIVYLWLNAIAQELWLNGALASLAILLLIFRIIFRSQLFPQLNTQKTKKLSDRRSYEKLEQALEEQISLFHSFMNHAPIVAWVTDAEGIIRYANQTFCDLLNRSKQDIIDNSIHELFPSELAWKYRQNNQQVIDTKQELEFKETFLFTDGCNHIYSVRKFPIYHEKNLVWAGGIALDVTDLNESKIQLQQSQEKYRRLLDRIGHRFLIYSYDPITNNVNYVSDNFEMIFGLKKEAIMGQSWPKVINWIEEDLDNALSHNSQMLNNRIDNYNAEMKFLHHDGRERLIRYFDHANRDETGQLIAIEGILEDITKEKNNYIALKESKYQLEQQTRKLELQLGELDQRNRDLVTLTEMSDFLQVANSLEEALDILPGLLKLMFKDCSGTIFEIDKTNDQCHQVKHWGNITIPTVEFSVTTCWALRRGSLQLCASNVEGVHCAHQKLSSDITSLCIPITSKLETFGLLFLCANKSEALSETKQQLARVCVEQIGLAISNLQLREELKQQSIIDPLTGLYNRRYLDAFLEKELAKAKRMKYSVGIIMLDIDHFKNFNDTYGHETGDYVLQIVSQLL